MSDAPPEFAARYAPALARLYTRARAARWNLGADVLTEAAAHGALKSGAIETDGVEQYLDALHAEDLALALACKGGNSRAWEHFISSLRPPLYAAARAIAGDEMRGRELADSLWADLYGLEVRDGGRRSLLEYCHGRSSILTWMRALLAQRHVDYIRSQSRIQPLDDDVEDRLHPNSNHDDPGEPERARYVRMLAIALDLALKTLTPQDRIRMAYYYRHELSLKEIGRLLNEHESTVSRKLARTREQLKSEIERRLRDIDMLSQDQIRLCYDFAAGDLKFDLARALPDSQ
jgi:RNA polymerase sigma-70 factor (ECF subfamily)